MQVAEDRTFTRDGADVYVVSEISFTQVRTKLLSMLCFCLSFSTCKMFPYLALAHAIYEILLVFQFVIALINHDGCKIL